MTTTLPHDPLAQTGLAGFAADFKAGRVTSEQVTQAFLDRIEVLEPVLGAFEYVARDSALATARAIDALFAAGTYLGPLMGVPVALKDVFSIDGMPHGRAGSELSLPGMSEEEGPFIRALRSAGCVFLGQTKAVELCLGITGVSAPRGTPWNPYDLKVQHAPGGSSSGSAVAVAAGMCAWAVGTDTGGSVRLPAAFNGVFGLKTTHGLWPTGGVFPLDRKLDTLGVLSRTAEDAAVVFQTISSGLYGINWTGAPAPVELDRLRFGAMGSYFSRDLDPVIAENIEKVESRLKGLGVRFDDVDLPEAPEREAYFPLALPVSALAMLGVEQFHEKKHQMDPIVAARLDGGLSGLASEYIRLEQKRQDSIQRVQQRFAGFDVWVSATSTVRPPTLEQLLDPSQSMGWALGMTRNTQPANYLNLCAVSLPIPQPAGDWPVGYQLMAPGMSETRLLSIAVALEKILGRQAPPALEL